MGAVAPAGITLTIAEACTILNPPITEPQLREIIHALRWQPDSHRHTGHGGRPPAAYNAERLMRLHAALVPFLPEVC